MVLGHLIYVVLMGFIFGMLWHYPLSMGLEKVVLCRNKLDWIRAGRYPKEWGDLDVRESNKETKNEDNENDKDDKNVTPKY